MKTSKKKKTDVKDFIPKNSEIVKESFEKIDPKILQKKNILENFSDCFEAMESKTYEIYMNYQKEAEDLSKRQLLESKEKQIGKIKERLASKGSGDVDKCVNEIGDIFWDSARDFEFSMGQSRKSRAGKALEMILMKLFQIADVPCEKPKGKAGKKFNNIDLLVPDLETVNEKEDLAVFLSIKRTLRERWKQADQEAKGGWTVYLITLDDDISEDLAKEIQNSSLYVYVKDSTKKRFGGLNRIRKLSDLPKDLSKFRK